LFAPDNAARATYKAAGVDQGHCPFFIRHVYIDICFGGSLDELTHALHVAVTRGHIQTLLQNIPLLRDSEFLVGRDSLFVRSKGVDFSMSGLRSQHLHQSSIAIFNVAVPQLMLRVVHVIIEGEAKAQGFCGDGGGEELRLSCQVTRSS
jgi:hypothetical protein